MSTSSTFLAVWHQVRSLPEPERRKLLHRLRVLLEGSDLPAPREIRERRFARGFQCPRCHAGQVIGWGHYRSGRRRYLCKVCRRTFNELTGTIRDRSHYESEWVQVARWMLDGLSVRKTAARVGVHYTTVFRWRHKLLRILQRQMEVSLAGIVEADETYLRQSQKGRRVRNRPPRYRGGSSGLPGTSREQVCILVARDRHRHTFAAVAGRGRLQARVVQSRLARRIAAGSTLVTDRHKAYPPFVRALKIEHQTLGSHREVRRQLYHLQNVNSWHRRFKVWLKRFHGVSTRHLNHYLTWFQFVEEARHADPAEDARRLLTTTLTAA